MSIRSFTRKFMKIADHWAPPLVCTFLTYYLGKGAFDGVPEAAVDTWLMISLWADAPIMFPRWAVLSGTSIVFLGGAFLWHKQYQRIKTLSGG